MGRGRVTGWGRPQPEGRAPEAAPGSWPARHGTVLHLFPLVTSRAQCSVSEMRFLSFSNDSRNQHTELSSPCSEDGSLFSFKFVYRKTSLQTLGCFRGCYRALRWEGPFGYSCVPCSFHSYLNFPFKSLSPKLSCSLPAQQSRLSVHPPIWMKQKNLDLEHTRDRTSPLPMPTPCRHGTLWGVDGTVPPGVTR